MLKLQTLEGGKFYPGTYADTRHMGDWTVFLSTSATCVGSALPGGAVDLAVIANDTSVAALVGPLSFEVDVGAPFIFQCDFNVSVDGTPSAAVFFGFTDRNSVIEVPIEFEDGSTNLTAVATDAVGLMLEREETATWRAVNVKGDALGANTVLTNTDHAIGTWQRLRIEVGASGNTDYYVGQYNSTNLFQGWTGGGSLETRSAAITTSVRMCPVITLDGRATAVTLQLRSPMFRGPGMEVTGG